MLDPKWLTRAIEQARRDLIDLTRRNRLLHAPLDGKRPWCMAITGQSPDELFEKLYRQENFRGYAFKPRKEESSEEQALAITSKEEISSSQEAASTRRPRLQTQLAPDKLQKRLAKIFREERTLEEEQGLSTLYLALGFLNWFDSDQAEASFAPLLLVPVTMVRVGGADGYLLRGRDDEIVSNISLREKLKSNFDINLSDVPDDDQWHPSSYYNAVARDAGRVQFISAAASGWRSHLSRYPSKACCYGGCAPGAIRFSDSNRPPDHLADVGRSIGRKSQFHLRCACDCYAQNHQRDTLHHREQLALYHRGTCGEELRGALR
jgi:hypothetical protein